MDEIPLFKPKPEIKRSKTQNRRVRPSKAGMTAKRGAIETRIITVALPIPLYDALVDYAHRNKMDVDYYNKPRIRRLGLSNVAVLAIIRFIEEEERKLSMD